MSQTSEQKREQFLANMARGREQAKAKREQARKSAQNGPAVLNDSDSGAAKPEQKTIRAPGPQAASQKQLEDWLAPVLAAITLLLALWLADGNESDFIADQVALSQDEMDALVPPLARMVARSPLNKRWGQQLIQSSDYVGAAVALTSYGMRIWPLVRLKLEGAGNGRVNTVQPTKQAGANPVTGNGYAEPGIASGYYSGYQ